MGMIRFYDAHLHLSDWRKLSRRELPSNAVFCTSSSSEEEFAADEKSALENPGNIFLSFGIHPQLPAVLKREEKTEREIRAVLYRLLDFFSSVVQEKRICAAGETGFDFFTEEFRASESLQFFLWEEQMNIAAKYGIPAVLHLRKAVPLVFREIPRLKLLPAVVFHGWPGSGQEASSILKKGVNAYFSVGKALLRGSRRQAGTIQSVPLDRILLETDAPYMTLKGEEFSNPEDIKNVYAGASRILGLPLEELSSAVEKNFRSVFSVR